MLGQPVQFQHLDMGEGFGFCKSRNRRDCRARSKIEKPPVPRKRSRVPPALSCTRIMPGAVKTAVPMTSSAPLALYLSRWILISPSTICRFRLRTTAMSIVIGPALGSELTGMMNQIRDLRAPDFIFARQAVGVGTRAPDILAFDNNRGLASARKMPGERLTAFPAADDDIFEFFNGHDVSLSLQQNLPEAGPGLDKIKTRPCGTNAKTRSSTRSAGNHICNASDSATRTTDAQAIQSAGSSASSWRFCHESSL